MNTLTNQDDDDLDNLNNQLTQSLKTQNISKRDLLYNTYDKLINQLKSKHKHLQSELREKRHDNPKLNRVYKQYKKELKERKLELERTIDHLEDLESYLSIMENDILQSMHDSKKEYTNQSHLMENIQLQKKRIHDELKILRKQYSEISNDRS
jgi:chromosome segregation ATPase